AQRRARGGPRGPAHHARRAQRAAGPRQREGGARHRATRPRGGVLHGAGGDRGAFAANPRAQDRGLRSGRSLPAGARRLGRRARARRAVSTKLRSFPPKRESRGKSAFTRVHSPSKTGVNALNDALWPGSPLSRGRTEESALSSYRANWDAARPSLFAFVSRHVIVLHSSGRR